MDSICVLKITCSAGVFTFLREVFDQVWVVMRFLILAFAIFAFGCAAIEQADRSNTEKLLAAAGFRVLPANTLKRQESLESMTPYKVERKIKGEEVYYLYACPDQSIAYIGGQESFSKYKELELQQEIANQNTISSQNAVMAAQQWNDWRVWGPSAFLPSPRMGGAR